MTNASEREPVPGDVRLADGSSIPAAQWHSQQAREAAARVYGEPADTSTQPAAPAAHEARTESTRSTRPLDKKEGLNDGN